MTDQHRTRADTGSGSADVRRAGGVTPAVSGEVAQAIAAVVARWQPGISDVRLRVSGGACGSGPGLIQVNLTVGGTPARVQIPGRSIPDAINATVQRLEQKLDLLDPTASSEPTAWQDAQARRPLAIALPGRITRLKSVPLARTTPSAASATLMAMDYDAHLFTDELFGQDAIIYRGGPSGLRLARQYSLRPPTGPAEPAIAVHPQRTPTMTPAQAANWLARHRLPQLFFTDFESRRGYLLYRRYDAHLTLVTPGPEQP